MIDKNSRVMVTGHRGLVGSAIVRRLQQAGCENVITSTRDTVDLRNQEQVDQWFEQTQPEFVFHVAGLVGGIVANASRPADFLYDNTLIHATVMRSAQTSGTRKLLYLGSSCIYPRDCPQPIKEDYLLTGPLEKTNQGYAIAKITGLLACQAYREQYECDFISAMPTNLYGPGDNFDLENSHVLPALIRKFHEAKVQGHNEVTVWGTGAPKREFLFVDDLADACFFIMNEYSHGQTINVGTGVDLSIRELAETIRDVVNPSSKIVFDTSRPDGTPRKLLDVGRLHELGWKHQVDLAAGIQKTYEWFQDNLTTIVK